MLLPSQYRIPLFIFLLLWLASVAQASSTPVYFINHEGLDYLATSAGNKYLQEFMRAVGISNPALMFAGLLFWKPRTGFLLSTVMLCGSSLMMVWFAPSLYAEPAYWMGTVLPVLLLSLAALLAFRHGYRLKVGEREL